MKTILRVIPLVGLAACSSSPTIPAPSAGSSTPAPTAPSAATVGLVTAADTTADAGPDVVPVGGMMLPSAQGNGLRLVRLPNDGGLNCIAPAVFPASCRQISLDRGYYFTDSTGAMLDNQGGPIAAPLGDVCPTGGTGYEVTCGADPNTGTWGMAPAGLGCVEAIGNDFVGYTYCCPCP
jgi:hypothetical protein